MMDGTMAIIRKFLEDMTHSCLGSHHGLTWDTQSLSQHIGSLEANAMDIQRQPIRILPYTGFPQFWSKKRRSVTLQPSRGRLDKSEQSSVTLVVTSSADLSLPPAYLAQTLHEALRHE
jgi:hypothetical protein